MRGRVRERRGGEKVKGGLSGGEEERIWSDREGLREETEEEEERTLIHSVKLV